MKYNDFYFMFSSQALSWFYENDYYPDISNLANGKFQAGWKLLSIILRL